MELLREHFNDHNNVSVLDTYIPQLAAYNKAAGLQIPVHRYEKKRSGPTMSAYDTMKNLVNEFIYETVTHPAVLSNEV